MGQNRYAIIILTVFHDAFPENRVYLIATPLSINF